MLLGNSANAFCVLSFHFLSFYKQPYISLFFSKKWLFLLFNSFYSSVLCFWLYFHLPKFLMFHHKITFMYYCQIFNFHGQYLLCVVPWDGNEDDGFWNRSPNIQASYVLCCKPIFFVPNKLDCDRFLCSSDVSFSTAGDIFSFVFRQQLQRKITEMKTNSLRMLFCSLRWNIWMNTEIYAAWQFIRRKNTEQILFYIVLWKSLNSANSFPFRCINIFVLFGSCYCEIPCVLL
jgi:hypothetical protein